jgi:hypothetical protein
MPRVWRSILLAGGLAFGCDALLATQVLTGQTASGAYYQIKVPDGWKPGGPLVLFQHGLSFDPPKPTPSLGPLADIQLSEGYAIAATSYSQRSWALFDASDDNAQLLDVFKQQVGAPGAIVPWGGSLGGLIALKLAEDARFAPVPGVFSICPPAAGSRVWDSAIDNRLAYDVVCKDVNGGDLPTGAPPLTWAFDLSDIPDNLSDLQDEAQLLQTLFPVNVCTGVNLPITNGAMDRRLAQLEAFGHVTTNHFFLTDLGYATYGLSDLVRAPDKLNGLNPFTTAGVVYPDPVIDAGIARITANPFASLYFRWASDFRGRVSPATKVVSLHTSRDELVIPANQSALRSILPAQQLTSALVNETSPTHCGFNVAEGVAGWEALRAWMAGASQPAVADLQTGCQAAMTHGLAGPCRFDASIVPANFDSQVPPRPTSTAAPVDARYSGLWYDPTRSGEGIELEILPGNKAVVYFFTYPASGVAGTQAWMYGIGDVVGNGIEFADIQRPSRDATGKMTPAHWGRVALVFDDCSNAGMRWDGPSGWGGMEVKLHRLLALNGLDCASGGAAPAQPSGAWYDPATSGDGFVVEQFDSAHIGAMYFVSNPDGTQTWSYGVGTATGAGAYHIDLLMPVGTHFGSAFDPSQISKPPYFYALDLSFGCTTGQATLSPRVGLSPTRILNLRRLTTPQGIAACTP